MTARLFTIGDFRFSVATAIGKWSRLATMGVKEKDGSRMEFTADTLGQMVDNFARRGDKLAICQDHLSAYVAQTGRAAPALGYFTSLAVVQSGKVVKFATVANDTPPDPSALDDGLYACLGEVTPLGADPKEGFAGFAFLSPMFSESAKDEAGNEIGMALYDAAVTNTPFQQGCAIQFHRAGAEIMFHKLPTGAPMPTNAPAAPVTMGIVDDLIAQVEVAAGNVKRNKPQYAREIDRKVAALKSNPSATAAKQVIEDLLHIEQNMSASTGAARRMSQEPKMDETAMAAHFGWTEEDDTAEKKLAKVCARMAQPLVEPEPQAMAAKPFEGKETPEEEKLEEEEIKEHLNSMAATFGINPAGMPRKVLMTAIRTMAKPAAPVDEKAIEDRIRASLKAEADAAAAQKMGAEITERAVKFGMKFDKDEERAAFVTFAAANPTAAEAVVKALPGAKVLSRFTAGGAPVGAQRTESAPATVEHGTPGNVRIMGQSLSAAAKKLLADGKASDIGTAQIMAIRANPALANE